MEDLHIRTLGECRFPSPFAAWLADKQTTPHFVHEDDRVMLDDTISVISAGSPTELPSFESAGPRRRIYFDPARTTVGIVSCGGLCPGVNNVIRGVVQELTVHYRVRRIEGFRHGLRGLTTKYRNDTIDLMECNFHDITRSGGTILGSSRGDQDADEMVDTLIARKIDILFVIGGDGSIRAAMRLVAAITRRGLDIAVVAIPKTIDNDLPYTDQSFGFQSAFERATDFIDAVATEAAAHENGVGIVKLMGRHSGFIACYAALANHGADMVLIPEVPFVVDGPDGLLARVERHLLTRGHVVIVVAEGAGQDLLEAAGCLDRNGTDASGNLRLGDIGQFLSDAITSHLTRIGLKPALRYIDPSYSIRSVTANAYDSVYCLRLAHAAVHAAMAGRTETVVVRWRRRFVHVPMPLITSHRNRVDPDGDLWMSVLEATNQPDTLARRCAPGPTTATLTETSGVHGP
jgi:6-phosphofructokinase 1